MPIMRTNKWLGIALGVVVALFGAGGAYAQTAQQIARKAFDSTVLLVMEDANGQPLSLGSGFFVGDGQIASNFHVIEGASDGYAKLVDGDVKYGIDGVVAVDMEHDLVILKVSAQSPTLPLGDSRAVQIGEPVYAVGNPQGLEGTFSQGIISSIREIEGDNLLQITAPISPGSSGGPVLNGKGEVIGVSVATFRGGQNLNFAIPANYLATLRNESDAANAKPLATIKTNKNRSSILSNWDSRGDDGVVGARLTWNEYSANGYSFSIRNKLRDDIKNVLCLVVFYDGDDTPIDVDYVKHQGIIPAKLAKRKEEVIAASTARLVKKETGRIIIRVLDFQLAK